MDFWSSLSGMVEVRLTSADLTGALSVINQRGIEIFSCAQEGELTLRFTLRRREYQLLRKLVRKRGETLTLVRRDGLYWTLRRLMTRPVLILGLMLILVLTIYLPGQIYFVEVDGNVTVPSASIIERANKCGIVFGADRREVRSEKMKNALLQALPELQWAGINTYGCRAVISVKERPAEETAIPKGQVSSIVATRDGVISLMTVQSGNGLCVPGQAVKAGQVLISGFTDCGICIRATRAQGEVYAQTHREMTALYPLQYRVKGQFQAQEKKYSLLIGKKLINFSKGSGISTTSCDKMYSVDYIKLPGGLRLPIALVTQTFVYYQSDEITLEQDCSQQRIEEFSKVYLTDIMTAGRIVQSVESLEWSEALCVLRGHYACEEMIGKTRIEEKLHEYGQTH